MKRIGLLSYLLAAVTFAGSVSRAQETPPQPEWLDRLFDRLDTNGDGVIDEEELLAPIRERFSRADRNNDGSLDREEMMAAREQLLGLLWAGPTRSRSGDSRMRDGLRGRLSGPPRFNSPDDSQQGRPPGQSARLGAEMAERIRQILDRIQRDSEGRIRVEDLPERLRARLSRLDTNEDGFLDEQELQGLRRLLQSSPGRSNIGPPRLGPAREAPRDDREQGEMGSNRRPQDGARRRGVYDSQGAQKPKRPPPIED